MQASSSVHDTSSSSESGRMNSPHRGGTGREAPEAENNNNNNSSNNSNNGARVSPGDNSSNAFVFATSAIRTPPPPGFVSDVGASQHQQQQVRFQSSEAAYGEAVRASLGSTSAPPPPGFAAAPDQIGGGGRGQRVDLAMRGFLLPPQNAMLSPNHNFHQNTKTAIGGSSGHSLATLSSSVSLANEPPQQQQQQQQGHNGNNFETATEASNISPSAPAIRSRVEAHHNHTNKTLLHPSALVAPSLDDANTGMRSKSYVQLAAALGEGLAESMDSFSDRAVPKQQTVHDATMSANKQGDVSTLGTTPIPNNTTNNDLSFPQIERPRAQFFRESRSSMSQVETFLGSADQNPSNHANIPSASAALMSSSPSLYIRAGASTAIGRDAGPASPTNSAAPIFSTSAANLDGEMDTYARHFRHAASRMIGSASAVGVTKPSELEFSSRTTLLAPVGVTTVPGTTLLAPKAASAAFSVDPSGAGRSPAVMISSSLSPSFVVPSSTDTGTHVPLPPTSKPFGDSVDVQHASSVGLTVREPNSGTTSPSLPWVRRNSINNNSSAGRTPSAAGVLDAKTVERMSMVQLGNMQQHNNLLGTSDSGLAVSADSFLAASGGRSSAPPQMRVGAPTPASTTALAPFNGTTTSSTAISNDDELQARAKALLELQQKQELHQHGPSRVSTPGEDRVGLPPTPPTSRTPEPSSSIQQQGGSMLLFMEGGSGGQAKDDDDDDISPLILRAEQELAVFSWEPAEYDGTTTNIIPRTSRGLVILRASRLHVPSVRTTCEAFGALLSFRADFCANRGVIFVTYHDLRSARYAATELSSCLKRLATPQQQPLASPFAWRNQQTSSSSSSDDVEVRYCVALNSSCAHDESIVLLSNMPASVNERDLKGVLASYGAVRGVRSYANAHSSGTSSFLVEFYDVQDAKQALLELDSTLPWGPHVTVAVGTRDASERRHGQDLMALIGRWRHGESTTMTTAISKPEARGGESPTTGDSVASSLSLRGASATVNTGSEKVAVQRRRLSAHSSPSPSPMPPGRELDESTQTTGQGEILQHEQDGESNKANYTSPDMDRQGENSRAISSAHNPSSQSTQLVVGPDGQYSYVLVDHPSSQHPMQPHAPAPFVHHIHHPQAAGGRTVITPQQPQQHIVHGPHGTYVTSFRAPVSSYPDHQNHYWVHPPPHPVHHQQYHMPATVITTSTPFLDMGHAGPGYPPGPTVPLYGASAAPPPHVGGPPSSALGLASTNTDSSVSSTSSGAQQQQQQQGVSPQAVRQRGRSSLDAPSIKRGNDATGGGGSAKVSSGADEEVGVLGLSIETVKNGSDTRTSLMVRNIPNKYTQRMLLTEFAESGHGSDKIDFFYLPIDFKNKCNRGYAFVNFVDYRDIVTFHHRYNGRHWKIFNSDKICDITYARIQGKEAMLKRFQNSALMEKDDEYKPLVFVSRGVDKGKREEFPPSSYISISSSLPLSPSSNQN